ncbi:NmrA family NAD(P)-binding protein [Mycolicibacterium stellerae]|uniref:NmrA family NAD(P)-binding protein n=1 Tax=Mycolicibacterium stellerae TaxID=2358193 RepID=UPI000F0BC8F8|nr:NmrA family NAD(P)-binding protein [Mycolicibacterium stellerae]
MSHDNQSGNELFLVTGATGQSGSQAVALLRERGKRVRALARGQDERAQRLRDLGAEVVEVDMFNYTQIREATEGVYAAYFNFPPAPGYVEAAAKFADAAASSGVHAVVEMSQRGIRSEMTGVGLQHWLVERLFDRTPMVTTHLRATIFMHWLENFWIRAAADEGLLRLPVGDASFAPINTLDAARVAVAVLQDPDAHDRQRYDLFGAEELDWHQIASKAQDTLGFPVRYESVEIAEMVAALTTAGIPDWLVQHHANVARDIRDGVFSGFNDLVETIGGSAPATIEQSIDANRAFYDTDGPLALTDARLERA